MNLINIKCLFLICTFFTTTMLRSQNENISEGNDFDGEPYLAINPINTSNIVVAWMGFDGIDLVEINTRVSFDGGNTWSTKNEIGHQTGGNTSADPSLAFDSEGNVFICYIDYNPFGTAGAVYVRKSIDGGSNWGPAVKVIDGFDDGLEMPVDRPWMVIDKSSGEYDGTIYITTKPAPWIPFPNRNYLIVSADGGSTFNDWKYIDTTGWRIGDFIQAPMASPTVSGNGTFHCIYPAWEISENILPRFIHASSTNIGSTLNYDEVIESFGGDLMTDTLPKLGYLLISDPTDPDHLVFSFILKSFGDADIFMLESNDAGDSWSDKIRINDDVTDNGVMQDMVWADFNTDGDLIITWRDRRNAIDTGYTTASEFFASVRWKDSTNFSANFKLSDQLVEFNDVLKENGNDFMSSEFIGDTVYAVWGEVRDSYLNIWFTKVSAVTGIGTGVQNMNAVSPDEVILYPNPTGHFIYMLIDDIIQIEIIDPLGKIVLQVNQNKNEIDVSSLPPGCYTMMIKTKDHVYNDQFIKI